MIVLVTKQPEPAVYVTVATPADDPVTLPEPSTAIRLLPVLQPPPGVASVNAIVEPTHTALAPVIPDRVELTVTSIVVVQPLTA